MTCGFIGRQGGGGRRSRTPQGQHLVDDIPGLSAGAGIAAATIRTERDGG